KPHPPFDPGQRQPRPRQRVAKEKARRLAGGEQPHEQEAHLLFREPITDGYQEVDLLIIN
ncbi:MAG TPA: hypothetical protein VM782_24060, partial [Stellaceae bacterium]|nr:hypothetical protein [Stellaceae bacterium]